jgi:hypothetical protein
METSLLTICVLLTHDIGLPYSRNMKRFNQSRQADINSVASTKMVELAELLVDLSRQQIGILCQKVADVNQICSYGRRAAQ